MKNSDFLNLMADANRKAFFYFGSESNRIYADFLDSAAEIERSEEVIDVNVPQV